jgi:hypothetical protein
MYILLRLLLLASEVTGFSHTSETWKLQSAEAVTSCPEYWRLPLLGSDVLYSGRDFNFSEKHTPTFTIKDAVGSFQTSVNLHQPSRRQIPEDDKLHNPPCHNLKSSWFFFPFCLSFTLNLLSSVVYFLIFPFSTFLSSILLSLSFFLSFFHSVFTLVLSLFALHPTFFLYLFLLK